MKVQMKSGMKEIKFGHRAIYNLKKDSGKELFELIGDISPSDINEIKMTSLYDLLYAALKDNYSNIEEMLDDLLDNKFNDYIEVIGDSVGKLFGANTETK